MASQPVAGPAELLERYAALVRGSPHNLMSRQAIEELAERHIPEAVRFSTAIPPDCRVLDLGAGGGLPGLVIAIMRPDLEVHLLEATGKKAHFLRDAVAALGLSVAVHHGRAEVLGAGALGGRVDVVTARAVARLDRLVVWAEPFLTRSGTLLAIKGERWREEVAEARTELLRLGLEVVSSPDAGHLTGAGGPLVVGVQRRSRTSADGGRSGETAVLGAH